MAMCTRRGGSHSKSSTTTLGGPRRSPLSAQRSGVSSPTQLSESITSGQLLFAGLAAKDVIDIQVTVAHLGVARDWPHEVLAGLIRRPAVTADHRPVGLPSDADEWAKLYWSNGSSVHLHVREQGRLNQRYALLFRDYLRADPAAAGAYGCLKRALADLARDDSNIYYAVKDPACDLILAGAEHWAMWTSWRQGQVTRSRR